MCPSGSAQIQTSSQPGGTASPRMRSSTSSSSIRLPSSSRYSNPLPRLRREIAAVAQSTLLRRGMAQEIPARGLRHSSAGQMWGVHATYVLPVRFDEEDAPQELTDYLTTLPDWVERIIVDGSPSPRFERHAQRWGGIGRHLRPDPALRTPMGKVAGVLTGVREAAHQAVVIADEDIRYDERSLKRTVALLGLADCVRPQNYFDSLPWHAREDMARTLLNRSLGADFPGTLAVRRSSLLGAGGYDGDVIFENLELMRTIRAAGGSVVSPLDLYVARRPPSAEHFLSQRVRQAYDDFAIPARMAAWLAVVPAVATAVARGHRRAPPLAAAALIGLAELGRRRAHGRERFPASASLLA